MATTRYQRPTNPQPVAPGDKAELLKQYFSYYERIANEDAHLLNVKLERSAVEELLNEVGGLLLEKSQALANSPGKVRDFLNANELPDCIRGQLPDEYRAYCLVLNALKQWVAAESAATDRYLLGGTVRNQCRKTADHCVVTKESLNETTVELHHPLRDGRPPIPLSKAGHDRIEFAPQDTDDPTENALRGIKREGNRSWVMLRRGCLALLGEEIDDATSPVLASSKTFARKASELTELGYRELIEWLDEHNLAQ